MQIKTSKLPHFEFGNRSVCTYCGDPATDMDHVIPVSFQTEVQRRSGNLQSYGPITPACHLCNSVLSNLYFSTFWDRCQYARDAWDHKAAPVEWHKWQLDSLDYTVRSHVEYENKKRLWYRQRADWFESRDFLLNIEMLAWEPRLLFDSKCFHKGLKDYFESMISQLKQLAHTR